MPDWSYEPFLKPALFALPPGRARALSLGALRGLMATPIGPAAIDFLGHLRAPADLERQVLNKAFASPIGLGAGLDGAGVALSAFARFGVGFVEVGPLSVRSVATAEPLRRPAEAARYYPHGFGAVAVAEVLPSLTRPRPASVHVAARIAVAPDADPQQALIEVATLMRDLAPHVAFLALQVPEACVSGHLEWRAPERLSAFLRDSADAARDHAVPLLLTLPPDLSPDLLEAWATMAMAAGLAGLSITGGIAEDGGRVTGASTLTACLATLRHLRALLGAGPMVIAGDGIVAPRDAVALLDAGADLVQLDAGLVFAGPGLPKRCNEALLARRQVVTSGTEPAARPWWLAHLGLGLGLVAAGAGALAVALTSVVLPYDLAWLGIDRAALAQINPRLLDFMRHDRASLSGTLISIGILYIALTVFGERHRVHWARRTMALSNGLGLASFVLFLLHGYLDPLHAVLWAGCLVLFLIGLRWRADGPPQVPVPDLDNDRSWRRATLGQLLWVVLGVGLVGGGIVIALLGSTRVFVPEDLVFMSTTRKALDAANRQLLPLIAHDRAGFGGALASVGLAVLGLALWGVRRGARWVWWALALAGLPGLLTGLGVHAAIGYHDPWHLAPAVLAVGLYAGGLALTWAYLGASVEPARNHRI